VTPSMTKFSAVFQEPVQHAPGEGTVRAAALKRKIDLLGSCRHGTPLRGRIVRRRPEIRPPDTAATDPPSRCCSDPVMQEAASEVRHRVTEATCSTVTNFLVGCAASMHVVLDLLPQSCPRAFMVSGICASTSGVQT
jgi:hypothetical protein